MLLQVQGAVTATAQCDCDLDPTIVVELLKAEAVVQKLGFQIIIEDLTGAWLTTGILHCNVIVDFRTVTGCVLYAIIRMAIETTM